MDSKGYYPLFYNLSTHTSIHLYIQLIIHLSTYLPINQHCVGLYSIIWKTAQIFQSMISTERCKERYSLLASTRNVSSRQPNISKVSRLKICHTHETGSRQLIGKLKCFIPMYVCMYICMYVSIDKGTFLSLSSYLYLFTCQPTCISIC